MRYTGTHVLALIQGEEKYELFKNGLASVIDDVNSMMKQRKVTINDHDYDLKFIVGGDCKVSQKVIN